MSQADDYFCIDDFAEGARRYLPRMMFDFAFGGIHDEVALRRNRSAFLRYVLKQRVLVDVSARDQSVELLDRTRKMPIVIAPTGPAGLVRHKGEIALARSAARAGIPFTLSSAASTPLEEVKSAAGGDLWFQLYVSRDVARSHEVIERARVAEYEALVLTVDSNIGHIREKDLRNGLSIPFGLNRRNVFDIVSHPGWLATTILPYVMQGGLPGFPNFPTTEDDSGRQHFLKNPELNWDHVEEIRKAWPRKLLLKGILSPDDAASAADLGADGIIVSNHGGNVFDAAFSGLEALPDIVDRVGGRVTLIVDGGVRRGADVVKAMALGADAVMVGRATLLGLAAAGEAGAQRALDILFKEIDYTLAMMGKADLGDVDASDIALAPFPD